MVIPKIEPILDLLYTPVTELAKLGPSETLLAIFLTYLAMFFLSLLLSLIKTPFLRKVYSSSLGLFLGFYCNGFGFIYVLMSYAVVQLTIYVVPSRRFAYILGHLHAGTFLIYGNVIDYQMGLSLKGAHFLIAILMAFMKQNMLLTNYADASDTKVGEDKMSEGLNSREKHMAAILNGRKPGFFEYWNYALFLCSCTSLGPVTEFRDSMEFLDYSSPDI